MDTFNLLNLPTEISKDKLKVGTVYVDLEGYLKLVQKEGEVPIKDIQEAEKSDLIK